MGIAGVDRIDHRLVEEELRVELQAAVGRGIGPGLEVDVQEQLADRRAAGVLFRFVFGGAIPIEGTTYPTNLKNGMMPSR